MNEYQPSESGAEYVVLVDEDDNEVGTEEKMAAHQAPGQLHRAISVVLFDSRGRMLLQQRAAEKHHFKSLWSNTCCTHPRPGENVIDAGRRRLGEEMGCDAKLRDVGSFIYRAEDPDSGLVEYELDHVLVGIFNGEPKINHEEARSARWMHLDAVDSNLATSPYRYTPWFEEVLEIARDSSS